MASGFGLICGGDVNGFDEEFVAGGQFVVVTIAGGTANDIGGVQINREDATALMTTQGCGHGGENNRRVFGDGIFGEVVEKAVE